VHAERGSCLQNAASYLGQFAVLVGEEVEPEDVVPALYVDFVLLEDLFVRGVQFFAAADVYVFEVQAERNQVLQHVCSDGGAAYVDVFQVLEVLSEFPYSFVLHVEAAKQHNPVQELQLAQVRNAGVVDVFALSQRYDFESVGASLVDVLDGLEHFVKGSRHERQIVNINCAVFVKELFNFRQLIFLL